MRHCAWRGGMALAFARALMALCGMGQNVVFLALGVVYS